MKRYKELFEKFKTGNLDENRIEELNSVLLKSYFLSTAELDNEELEYTEDLVIELSLSGKLDDRFALQLREFLITNKTLARKFHLLRNLREAHEQKKKDQMSLLLVNENTESEKEEEEQLSKILLEVIEKVHAEEEAGTIKSKVEILFSKTRAYFKDLLPSVILEQPRFQTALVFASILIIAGIVWISIRTDDPKLITGTIPDSVQTTPPVKIDSIKNEIKPVIQKPLYAVIDSVNNKQLPQPQIVQNKKVNSAQDSILKELDNVLLAYAEDIPSEIEYTELRSASSPANDLFILAAEKYAVKEYDNCAIILRGLLKNKEFRSPDTISEINFYLGIIYMTKGFDKSSSKLLNQASQFFGKVNENSPYFNTSKWYRALMEIKMGNKIKGKQLLDSLLDNKYLRSGEVLELRDKVGEIL